ncbi:MAG: putative toxin-antitoxin system toxin component, PIN family [Candidatus Omnitrophica bacterium]|nr:putative toxin-antitoxin system toxin component, PIN family [Candidatus Omnitrophota bacterium]
MIRVVLDTNVVVSALILQGPVNRLVELWREEKFRLVVSKAIVNEYLRVLAYPKFQLSTEEVKNLMEQEILPYIHPVEVRDVPDIIHEDPSDNHFLACAKAGNCQYLVSGDKHLLSLKHYAKIPIISVSLFLEKLTK